MGIVLGFQTALYGVTPPALGQQPVLPEMSLGEVTDCSSPFQRNLLLGVAVLLRSVGRLRGGAVTTAIEIDGISKMFRLHRERPTSVKQRLLGVAQRVRGLGRSATSRSTSP